MSRFEWTQHKDNWIGIYGKYRATVGKRQGPLLFSHWVLDGGGSGGTSSVQQSKRAAEQALEERIRKARVP